MSERHQIAHLIAEAAALISAVFLIIVSVGLPASIGWMVMSAGFGVVLVDCFFILSWKQRRRTRVLVYFHVVAEIMGVLCGVMLIYLALGLQWSTRSVFIFCTGTIMCLIDGLFVLTWLPAQAYQRIWRNQASAKNPADRNRLKS